MDPTRQAAIRAALGYAIDDLVDRQHGPPEGRGEAAPPQDDDPAESMRRGAAALAAGDTQLGSLLLEHAAPSIRLRSGVPTTRRSRFGGVPFLPPGSEWPRRGSGRPLHFIAQIDLAELPRADGLDPLPEAGTLAFFYDCEFMPPGFGAGDADGSRVVYLPAAAERAPSTPPPDTHEGFVLAAAGVRFEVEPSFDVWSLDLEEEEQESIADRLDADPIHRLLGEPDEIQNDPRTDLPGGDWQLLLQVDSGAPLELMLGDLGRIYFLMTSDDLTAGRFDRARVVMQCH